MLENTQLTRLLLIQIYIVSTGPQQGSASLLTLSSQSFSSHAIILTPANQTSRLKKAIQTERAVKYKASKTGGCPVCLRKRSPVPGDKWKRARTRGVAKEKGSHEMLQS